MFKRVIILCGHYGSGKTNVAVNLAIKLKGEYDKVAIADIDIVNPYYRAADSRRELLGHGIKLISSPMANTNVELPALPQEIAAITDDRSLRVIVDVGGDDRGAVALGRLSGKLKEENDYEMLLIINKYRPLTKDAESVKQVLAEIEGACRLRFTGIINNSNLGAETTANTVLNSVSYADQVAAAVKLPIVMTTAEHSISKHLQGKIPNLLPLQLQNKLF